MENGELELSRHRCTFSLSRRGWLRIIHRTFFYLKAGRANEGIEKKKYLQQRKTQILINFKYNKLNSEFFCNLLKVCRVFEFEKNVEILKSEISIFVSNFKIFVKFNIAASFSIVMLQVFKFDCCKFLIFFCCNFFSILNFVFDSSFQLYLLQIFMFPCCKFQILHKFSNLPKIFFFSIKKRNFLLVKW